MSNRKSGTPLTIGEILTDLREKSKETQEQVAGATGISKATLSSYENNNDSVHKAHIRLDYLCKLAKYYGVSINYLMGSSTDTELMTSSTESEIATEQFTSNALIDIFENAVDKYHIDEFMNYEFSFTPLHQSTINVICEFIWELQNILPKFRRNQDSISRNVNDFINIIEEYLDYLGCHMDTDDGEIFYRLRNIDLQKAQEDTALFRTRLNEIYSLITNGGTFAIFRV